VHINESNSTIQPTVIQPHWQTQKNGSIDAEHVYLAAHENTSTSKVKNDSTKSKQIRLCYVLLLGNKGLSGTGTHLLFPAMLCTAAEQVGQRHAVGGTHPRHIMRLQFQIVIMSHRCSSGTMTIGVIMWINNPRWIGR
jgi:hypothetical protein